MSGHLNGDVFDIDTIGAEKTADVPIVHPSTGEPTSWKWTLAGPGHPKSVEVANKAAKDQLRLDAEREKAQTNRKKWTPQERTPDQNRQDNAEALAHRVLGWTPARINGADYPYSYENTVKLLLDPDYSRVYLQLLEYFVSETSFTRPSVPNSSPSLSETSS